MLRLLKQFPKRSSSILSFVSLKSLKIKPTIHNTNGSKAIGAWLLGGSALVFGIVVVGGLTRLTESGLSMVDWSLLHVKPPLNEYEWQKYFDLYKKYPEFKL